MLNQITASAFFPSSGATLKADYQPRPGITAVVGDNGSGKSFLSVEVPRWLLYGKAALRGAAADYKDASAHGIFTIRGARYEISRGKHEWVKDASGEVVAKGAEKVTEYVTELMGYGLDVFDLCNAATQGNVQKLGSMRPAERKAIIDKVLRLSSAEQAEKDCREEAKGYKREVDTLTKMLRAPGDEPVAPANYSRSTVIRDLLDQDRRTMEDAEALRARLRHVEEPVNPNVAPFEIDAIDALQRHEDERRRVAAERAQLQAIVSRAIPYCPENWSEDQLVAAEQRLRVQHALDQRGPAPLLTAAQSEHNWAAWALYDAYRPTDAVECPKCRHTFRTNGEAPPQPAWTKTALREDDARRAKHASPAPTKPAGPDLTQQQIDHARAARKASEEFNIAQARLNELATMEDRSAELETMRTAKATLEAFLAEQQRYERVRAQNEAVQRELDELGSIPTQDELAALYERLSEAERYEAECRSYDAAVAAFRDTQAQITEAQHLADEYAAGAKDVAAARAVVKAMIAPKISRIATALIRDMSLGKLPNLVVDDEMEVTVGGQRIETLSGAGKTVANLALRVAFGRALVGHTFPVFLADEIDGDMTPARREATLQSLVSLKQHMTQIILVTHRGADIADQVWDVETTE